MKFLSVRLFFVGAAVASGLTTTTSLLLMSNAKASSPVPICLNTQLELAVAWGVGDAMDHTGVPFVIANISKSSCTLEGYPDFLLYSNYKYENRILKVVDGGGVIFGAVKPRVVILKPGGDASFGLNYVDSANQQDPSGPACTTQYFAVGLPVRYLHLPSNYVTTLIFNFCYSDFQAEVTAIQAGPLPERAK